MKEFALVLDDKKRSTKMFLSSKPHPKSISSYIHAWSFQLYNNQFLLKQGVLIKDYHIWIAVDLKRSKVFWLYQHRVKSTVSFLQQFNLDDSQYELPVTFPKSVYTQ